MHLHILLLHYIYTLLEELECECMHYLATATTFGTTTTTTRLTTLEPNVSTDMPPMVIQPW